MPRRGKNLSTSVRLGDSVGIATCTTASCEDDVFTAVCARLGGTVMLSNGVRAYRRPSTSTISVPESSVTDSV